MSGGTRLALAFGAVLLAGLLLSSGIRNRSLSELLKGVTAAKPEEAQVAYAGSTAGQSGTQSGTATGLSGGQLPAAPSPAAAGSEKSIIQQTVAYVAKGMGWSAADWEYVIAHESGFSAKSVNPQSGAAGVGQALGATKTQFPKMVSGNPVTETYGMAEYIASRYGNPTAARRHEEAHNWY